VTQNLKPTDNPTNEAHRDRIKTSRAMIYAGIFFILALGVALILMKAKSKQLSPGATGPHTTSQLTYIARTIST
jgi:hypothetical protein